MSEPVQLAKLDSIYSAPNSAAQRRPHHCKSPDTLETPAVGNWHFDFLNETPGTPGGEARAHINPRKKRGGGGGGNGGGIDPSDLVGLLIVLVAVGWYFSPDRVARRISRQPSTVQEPTVPSAPDATIGAPVKGVGEAASLDVDAGSPPTSEPSPTGQNTFAGSTAPAFGGAKTQSPPGSNGPAPLVVFARHKHRMGDCEGTLTFAIDTIQFESDEPKDSFIFSTRDVALDDDGMRDPYGKAWHFVVAGRDMEETFRHWKAGRLTSTGVTDQQE
jgi:hypothetical protein